jgi:Mg-chelatase subunit ChlD
MDEDEGSGGRASGLLLPIVLTLLLVVGLGIGGSVAYLLWAQPEGTASADGCGGSRPVDLTVAPEIYDVVVRSLEEAAPTCVQVTPDSRPGGDVARGVSTGGALPDLWIPESRFWLGRALLGDRSSVRMLSPSVARTPLLLVGGDQAQRFPTWGDAEVSGLVSVPDPVVSTVGALAVLAPQTEARSVGRTTADARQMVVPFAQEYGARRTRGDDETVWPTMFPPQSPRLVVTTEQELGTTDGAERLRDLTPPVGAPALNFPLVARADAAPGTREVARGLLDYLDSEDGIALLTDQGLRPPQGAAASAASATAATRSEVATYLPTPLARNVSDAVQSWKTLAIPSAILAVVDASGSMDFDAGTGTRMDLLADAAGIGLSFLPDHARVGLWVFSIDQGGSGQDWRVLEPIRRLDDLRSGRTQRSSLRQWATRLPSLTNGGTGLYDTALAAYQEAVRRYRPHYSNAVVLMTDGQNEDPGSIRLKQLLDRLRELRDPDRPVRIVGIAISDDADLGALERMARATGGDAYLAEQPQDILGVFARAVLSR